MRLRFTSEVKVDNSTGDLQLTAYVGNVPVRCIVKRSAVAAGLSASYLSDGQILDLYHARRSQIQSIASLRFENGECQPTVSYRDMTTH
jgi:hypothetical protein